MTRKIFDMVGQQCGRWTPLKYVGSRLGRATFLCRCECGVQREVHGSKLRSGASRSCGCLGREVTSNRLKTHGLSKHPLFPTWLGMMSRCYNPQSPAYRDYGNRGIYVCNAWHDVTTFIAENENKTAPGLSMDRINNDGPYHPENIRWTTRIEQARNRRSNVLLTFHGKTQTAFEWAAEMGINPKTLVARISDGWSAEDALTIPVSRNNKLGSMVEFRGRRDTIANFAREIGLDPMVVGARIRRNGWSVEKSLTTPNRGPKARKTVSSC